MLAYRFQHKLYLSNNPITQKWHEKMTRNMIENKVTGSISFHDSDVVVNKRN